MQRGGRARLTHCNIHPHGHDKSLSPANFAKRLTTHVTDGAVTWGRAPFRESESQILAPTTLLLTTVGRIQRVLLLTPTLTIPLVFNYGLSEQVRMQPALYFSANAQALEWVPKRLGMFLVFMCPLPLLPYNNPRRRRGLMPLVRR